MRLFLRDRFRVQFSSRLNRTEYEVCLKSNGTVHAARKTFIAEKKTLLSMMLQCLMVSKAKFQHSHSLTTTFFFARFFCQGTFVVTVL